METKTTTDGVRQPLVESELRLRRPDRSQMFMEYGAYDDLIPPDHIARVIVRVLGTFNFDAFYIDSRCAIDEVGRDGTDARMLAALWLLAAVQGIGAARELDRRCVTDAPFKWICGGVSVNYHLLADFRVGHEKALDDLFTRVLAVLVDKGIVSGDCISQDGIRTRAAAGSGSFRSESRLETLLQEAKAHVQALKAQLNDPEQSAAQKAARQRAARERQARIEEAIAQLPELKRRQEKTAQKAGKGKRGQKVRDKVLRASTTDAFARVMHMANGGFQPAVNLQLASDTASRAIVGVMLSNEGNDAANLSGPMRQQVQQRLGKKVEEHLIDGGYLSYEDIAQAHAQGVALFVPPKPARNPEKRGHELDPKAGDSPAIAEWKQRMSSEQGKQLYKQRASTSETVNADCSEHRGLRRFLVRGAAKTTCVATWFALSYNIMHFASHLLGS